MYRLIIKTRYFQIGTVIGLYAHHFAVSIAVIGTVKSISAYTSKNGKNAVAAVGGGWVIVFVVPLFIFFSWSVLGEVPSFCSVTINKGILLSLLFIL